VRGKFRRPWAGTHSSKYAAKPTGWRRSSFRSAVPAATRFQVTARAPARRPEARRTPLAETAPPRVPSGRRDRSSHRCRVS